MPIRRTQTGRSRKGAQSDCIGRMSSHPAGRAIACSRLDVHSTWISAVDRCRSTRKHHAVWLESFVAIVGRCLRGYGDCMTCTRPHPAGHGVRLARRAGFVCRRPLPCGEAMPCYAIMRAKVLASAGAGCRALRRHGCTGRRCLRCRIGLCGHGRPQPVR